MKRKRKPIQKPKLAVLNANDVIPDLSKYFDIIGLIDILYADAVLLAHDVNKVNAEICKTAREYGIPSFIMQHGRFAMSDYAFNGKDPIGDFLFAWGDDDIEMAKQGGWKPEQVIQVGSAQLDERVKYKPDGKTVVFAPIHIESLESVNKRNKTESQEIWKGLCNIKGIKPIVKLLDGEHSLEHFKGGENYITNRQEEGQAKKTFKLLSKASCVVSQVEGTFELFAYAMDIPVVKIYGHFVAGDMENKKWIHHAGDLVKLENMEDAVLDAIGNPEVNRTKRADIVRRDGGKLLLNTRKLITKAIKKEIARPKKQKVINKDKPKITYFLREKDQSSYYRIMSPLAKIQSQSGYTVKKVIRGEGSDKIANSLTSDLFIFPTLGETKLLDTAYKLKDFGKKIILDFDENVFDPSPLSPRYQRLGTQAIDVDGVPMWINGKNIDLAMNNVYVENVEVSLGMADMVTVATENLKDVYSRYNDNVRVVPTCLDLDVWKKFPFERNQEIRVGWHGSWASMEDVGMLKQVIPDLLAKYPMMKLVLLGYHPTLKGIPEDRVERHPWVSIDALPYKMASLNLDIGLLPSADNQHSKYKNFNKWLEYSALEVPTVCSFVPPYTDIADNNNGVYIENNDPDGWLQGISLLVEDTILAAKMAGEARRIVERDYDINTKYPVWQNAYREVM